MAILNYQEHFETCTEYKSNQTACMLCTTVQSRRVFLHVCANSIYCMYYDKAQFRLSTNHKNTLSGVSCAELIL